MSGPEDRLLRLVASSRQIGLIVVDRELRYRFANAGYAELVGSDVDHIVGRTIPEVVEALWETRQARRGASPEPLPPDDDALQTFAEEWRCLKPHIERAFAEERVQFELIVPAVAGSTLARTFEVLCERRCASDVEPEVIATFVDITGRRLAERASRRSEHEFRMLVETLPQLVWTASGDGRCNYVSPQFTRYTGRSEGHSHGQGWLESVHPEDRERVMLDWRRVLATGDDMDLELRMRRADGVYRWFVCHAASARGDGGKVRHWIGSCTDIEDQRQLTHDLYTERNVLRTVVDAIPDAVFTKDLEGRIVVANRAAGPPLGYPDHRELIGKTAADLLPPPAAERVRLHDALALAGEKLRFQQAIAAHGEVEPRCLDTIKAPLRDAAGNISGLVCIVRDVTEAERAEHALRESEQHLRMFIEHAPAALAMFDHEMRYMAVSRRWKSDYDLVDRDVIGQCHYDVMPEVPESWREIHRRCLAGEVIQKSMDRFERSNGPAQWLRWEVRPWTRLDGSVGGVAIFAEDITQIKDALDELARVNANLEVTVQKLAYTNHELTVRTQETEAFVYSVSHDLRSPLVNLQGFSSELKRTVDALRASAAQTPDGAQHRESTSALDGRIDRSIHFIQAAVARLGSIIDALLRLSRAGRVVYRPQLVDVAQLVARVVDALGGTIASRKAEVEILPLTPIHTDPAALEQIFANLLGNALNYLDEHRPGRITIGSNDPPGGGLEYFVRDNGLGIPESGISKLFKPFQRLHPRAAAGEGMGLAIVQRVVSSLGGTIRCTSVAGEGSTFSITFPAVEPTEKRAPERREQL